MFVCWRPFWKIQTHVMASWMKFREVGIRPREFLVFWGCLLILNLILYAIKVGD